MSEGSPYQHTSRDSFEDPEPNTKSALLLSMLILD